MRSGIGAGAGAGCRRRPGHTAGANTPARCRSRCRVALRVYARLAKWRARRPRASGAQSGLKRRERAAPRIGEEPQDLDELEDFEDPIKYKHNSIHICSAQRKPSQSVNPVLLSGSNVYEIHTSARLASINCDA